LATEERTDDGLRRYLQALQEIEQKADRAIALSMGGILGSGDILGIAYGGTGSSTQNFIDLFTDQYEIFGQKIFRNSVGFQLESYPVISPEIAGNIRLISCSEPDKDVGPQLRFSGRSGSASDSSDLTAFAYAVMAGRKENATIGDFGGYYQMCITDYLGNILEAARIDSEGNMFIGKLGSYRGQKNRLWVSGGDIFLDNEGENREYRLQSGETHSRWQSLTDWLSKSTNSTTQTQTEHSFLSQNVKFIKGGECSLDQASALFGSAAIELRVDSAETGGEGSIRFWTGRSEECPNLMGLFDREGFDVFGDILATQNIIAGGINNVVDGVGNNIGNPNGFITGDNIKYGIGSPEGRVYGPIGAIYGRREDGSNSSNLSNENTTLWVKVFNEGENTGWIPIPLSSNALFCIQDSCPDVPTNTSGSEGLPGCTVWFDTNRKILFFWDPDVVRSRDPLQQGAWLSVQLFQLTIPVTGRSHSQQFRGEIDKDYEYLTPIHVTRQLLNMYLVDLTAALRVARNSSQPNYSIDNYYTFDLVALERRQGDPSAKRSTRQEWPGDRESYEGQLDNLRADGHTYFPYLRDELVALSSATPTGAPVDGVGTITQIGATRRVLIDANKNWTSNQWKERENPDSQNGYAANNGYLVRMLSGIYAGIARTIRTNSENTLVLRRPWPKIGSTDRPAVGDQYEILDSEHKKIIARISTKGNIYPDGAHVDPTKDRNIDPPPLFDDYQYDDSGVLLTRSQVTRSGQYITKDVQDFVTSIMNGLNANDPGGSASDVDQHIKLDHYVDVLGSSSTNEEATNAVVVAGLWDSIRRPGKISGVISLTYRLALSPDGCGATIY